MRSALPITLHQHKQKITPQNEHTTTISCFSIDKYFDRTLFPLTNKNEKEKEKNGNEKKLCIKSHQIQDNEQMKFLLYPSS